MTRGASPRNAQACPHESWGCQEPFFDCCCDRGVICVSTHWECDQFCG